MRIKSVVTSLVFLLLASGVSSGEVAQQGINQKDVVESINNNVYEVVLLKPTKDTLSYEKELPLDLIPFSIRSDKYIPVGTAFKIESNLFVSAAHVMNFRYVSQFEEVYLRDSQGEVFEMDKFVKYSDHRDFVVFTLKNYHSKSKLKTNVSPNRNEPVLAVGNALGQGIIIRDGLYTSDTPEEENGEWKWMRFSAAASPGNSGGPLLDKEGKVIGVVLRKSENENLNYALPISEVLAAKENLAISHGKTRYTLANMYKTKLKTYNRELKLPMSYRELKKYLVKSFSNFGEDLLQELLAENKADIFPNGKGANILLQSNYSAIFPHIIAQERDGNWGGYSPSETQKSELGNNGFLEYGRIVDSTFMYMETPDNIPIEKFYKDSKLFMDTVLKGVTLYRDVQAERIKITSLGKAQEDYIHTDSYGRKWMVRSWLMEFDDLKLMSFSLPVPGGFVSILNVGQTGFIDNALLPDIKLYTDFIYLSYYGTLKQWTNYLKNKKILPAALADLDLSVDYNKKIHLKTKRVDIESSQENMDITPKSYLTLKFSFFKDQGKVVWDIGGIVLGEDKNNGNHLNLTRVVRPAKDLSDSYKSTWMDVQGEKFPYNETAYFANGKTIIRTTVPQSVSEEKETQAQTKSNFMYTASFFLEGKIQEEKMKNRLASISQKIKILEK